MKAADFIRNPQLLDGESTGALRRLLERYPYYQTARLLLLQNLFKTKDPLFEKELCRSAALICDRGVLFEMVEGKNYQIPDQSSESADAAPVSGDRTLSLIDGFLKEVPEEKTGRQSLSVSVAADSTTDYVAWLLQEEGKQQEKGTSQLAAPSRSEYSASPRSSGRIQLQEKAEYEIPEEDNTPQEEFFTETLAKIYIKQQKYERALEIIRAISAANSSKNAYFADQIRYLEKLIRIKTTKDIENV